MHGLKLLSSICALSLGVLVQVSCVSLPPDPIIEGEPIDRAATLTISGDFSPIASPEFSAGVGTNLTKADLELDAILGTPALADRVRIWANPASELSFLFFLNNELVASKTLTRAQGLVVGTGGAIELPEKVLNLDGQEGARGTSKRQVGLFLTKKGDLAVITSSQVVGVLGFLPVIAKHTTLVIFRRLVDSPPVSVEKH